MTLRIYRNIELCEMCLHPAKYMLPIEGLVGKPEFWRLVKMNVESDHFPLPLNLKTVDLLVLEAIANSHYQVICVRLAWKPFTCLNLL